MLDPGGRVNFPGGRVNFLDSLWLVAASFIAGALNAVAGGGSFLSFPSLLGVGVPPIEANATNTVALWPGQLASSFGFMDELKANGRLVLPLCSAALLGGLAGAIVLLRTGQTTFMALVPWLLLLAAILFAVSGLISRWLQRRAASRIATVSPSSSRSLVPLWTGVLIVGFYIGYFGAGGGFLIMAMLALFGIENIHQINALKVITAGVANGTAIVTFVIEKKVIWQYCVLMMGTAAIGGYLGARYSRRLNPQFMRGVVVLLGLGIAAYFFWRQYA